MLEDIVSSLSEVTINKPLPPIVEGHKDIFYTNVVCDFRNKQRFDIDLDLYLSMVVFFLKSRLGLGKSEGYS